MLTMESECEESECELAGNPSEDICHYQAFNNDPINNYDPTGLSAIPDAQPTPPRYAGTFLDNMSPAAAAALAKGIGASPNGRLTNVQAFAVPLTGADAMIFLHANGKDSMATTPGMMRDGSGFHWYWDDGGPYFAEDNYADALKKNPALGLTQSQYYAQLADQYNIAAARYVMQAQGNGLMNLYARLALPIADLVAAAA